MRRPFIIMSLICLMLILSSCRSQTNFQAAENEQTPIYVNKKLPIPGEENYDENGIVMYDYGIDIGMQYNPLFIANDAISFYNDYHGVPEGFSKNDLYQKYFYEYINWFIENSEIKEGVGRLLPYQFDSDLGGKAPWVSAITQARVAKAFVMAYRWSGDEIYLSYAQETIKPLFLEIDKGGLLFVDNDIDVIFFEEYINPPDHSLNGHMSVILNLLEVNEVLESEEVGNWIQRGVDGLKKVLPLYEMADEMAYASKSEVGGDFKNFSPSETYMRSYDQIHIYYFEQLYKWTGDEVFKQYFYRYYSMLSLKTMFKENINILSNENSIVSRSSTFFDEPHDLTTAINNYRYNINQYSAGEMLPEGESAFIEFELHEPKKINLIELQFRYPEYPKKFTIKGFTSGQWKTIINEANYSGLKNSTDVFKAVYKGDESFEKISFSASDFTNQNRLLLGHFTITEKISNEMILDIMKKNHENEIIKYVGMQTLEECVDKGDECHLSEYLISVISNKLYNDVDDFWSISRPIIDELAEREIEFNKTNIIQK